MVVHVIDGGPREQNDECTFDPTWATAVELGNGCRTALGSADFPSSLHKLCKDGRGRGGRSFPSHSLQTPSVAHSSSSKNVRVLSLLSVVVQKCQGPPDSYHHWKSKALGRCISTCNEVHAKAEEKGHTGHRAKKGVAAAVQNKGMHGFCCSASGKSSVMEALTGVALPRASGTCTRCAFEISTKRELGRRASL